MIFHRLTLLSSFVHRSSTFLTRSPQCQLFKLNPNRQFSLTPIRSQRGDRPPISTKNAPKRPKVKLTFSDLRRLFNLAQHEKGRIGCAIALLLLSSGVTMSVPYFLGKIIDMLQTYKHDELRQRLKQMTFVLVGIFAVGALANFGRVYLILTTSQRIIKRIREQLFNGILRKEMAFFDKQKTGELVNRLSSDTEVMSNAVTQNISDGLRALTQSIAGVGLMFYISPQLALVGLTTVPPLAVGAILFGRYIKRLSSKVQDTLAQATSVAEERFSNIRTVKAFSKEEQEIKLYNQRIGDVLQLKYKESLAYGLFFGMTGLSGNLIVLSVFYFGGISMSEESLTIGDLSSFLLYAFWVGVSISGIFSFHLELMKGVGASQAVWSILNENYNEKIALSGQKQRTIHGDPLTSALMLRDITFDSISFRYPTRQDALVLDNLTLRVPGGKVLAICGSSGSGKSTLAQLLLRFYEPQSGQITIGNIPINDMPLQWLRTNIGTVPQEPVLFSSSIYDNISYGYPSEIENAQEIVLKAKVIEAANTANASGFIEQLPEKYDTKVGERGTMLSGGQKQRVALGRAILRDPSILVLDEATSALDTQSEYLVQEALEKIMVNRTVIIIAHRLSTIIKADQIAVLDKGRIGEQGTYAQLMNIENGIFRKLVATQTMVDFGGDKQTIEGSLNTIHSRLKCYTNDQITILDDIISIIESYYKTEKHTHERMHGSLQKSLEHTQSLSYLGTSIIGSSWTTALKELAEHYAQREASYPVLRQVILENLKIIKNGKVDEHNKVLLYDEEIIKEMADIERRTMKARRAYDEAFERLRQYLNPVKEKESSIKRLQSKISPKNELERLETAVVDTRNMYILYVSQMNYALKFYIEQFIVDLDKLLVCDLFPQIEKTLEDLVYSEYKRLRDTLQRAIHQAVEDGDEQKRRLLPKTFQNYNLVLPTDQSDQINTDEKHLSQLASTYASATNDVRDADQQIQLALDNSVLNAPLNKDSRMDSSKIKLKRMEMRKSMASFILDTLEKLVPNIKTLQTPTRSSSKLINGLKPFISSSKSESSSPSIINSIVDTTTTSISLSEFQTSQANASTTSMFPCQAVVLYDFDGANEGEISVRKDDKIFIESKPEYEGWLVAKGRDGYGLVPETYVQLLTSMATPIDQGSIKNHGNMTDNSLEKKKKQLNNSNSIPSTPGAVDDEADYFSDDE
ncbi:unnamed protein product [Adineta steineri]|uniref:Uncharacterized protein n=1 Tax=Adineta steineri TaxID=433720 RepID=A0A818MCP2_9BILA|nr:unnamed protein product [Adineta steineri]CAF3583932.1 unnamed protein product [Adineta steineri]